MEILKMLQKVKINATEFKSMKKDEVENQLKEELLENPYNPLIGSLHPTWHGEIEFPPEVYQQSITMCYMDDVLPESGTAESIIFFFDLMKNKRLDRYKGKESKDMWSDLYSITKLIPNKLMEAITIHYHLFDNLKWISKLVKENPDSPFKEKVLNSVWHNTELDEYLQLFDVPKNIELAYDDFRFQNEHLFPSLGRIDQEKIIMLAEKRGLDVKKYLTFYMSIPHLRMVAREHIEPSSYEERFAAIKKVSYHPHYEEVIKAYAILGHSNAVHYRDLQERDCDLEFLGMNRIRKTDLVTRDDLQTLADSLPFVTLDVTHRVTERGHKAFISKDGQLLMEFEYNFIDGKLDIEKINFLDKNKATEVGIYKSKSGTAFYTVLSEMVHSSDVKPTERTINVIGAQKDIA